MSEFPSFILRREGLQALVACGLAGAALTSNASDLCDLKYQASARGQWAIQSKPGEHFVFRTQRKLLEPPVIDGVAAYVDMAEDAALDSLTAYMAQLKTASGKSGELIIGHSLQPQPIRCSKIAWTVFTYDLAKVSWIRPAVEPSLTTASTLAPATAMNTVAAAPVPAPSAIKAAPALPSTSVQTLPGRAVSPASSKARASNLKTNEE